MKWMTWRPMRIALGVVFLLLGFAGLVLPVLQGLLFLFVGIMLLAPDIPFFKRILDWLEVRFPKMAAHAKRWRWWPRKRT